MSGTKQSRSDLLTRLLDEAARCGDKLVAR
jgi:hypothetical protein